MKMQYQLNEEQIKELSEQLVNLLNIRMKNYNNYISAKLDAITVNNEYVTFVSLPYTLYTLEGDGIFSSEIFYTFNDSKLELKTNEYLFNNTDQNAILLMFFRYMKSQFGDEYMQFIKNHYTSEKIKDLKNAYQNFREEEKEIIEEYKDVESAISEVNK